MVMPQIIAPKETDRITVSVEPPASWQETNSASVSIVSITLTRDYLTWEDDPVLAELWDNEEDAAAFDNL
jgi:hypothetical protein